MDVWTDQVAREEFYEEHDMNTTEKRRFKYPFCPGCQGPIDVFEWEDTGHELVAVCPACYGKGKPRRLDPGHVLPNGGIVLAYKNNATDPAILGKVLVFLPNNDFHPFATWTYNWTMVAEFRTVGGSYFETLAAAAESFGLEVSNV